MTATDTTACASRDTHVTDTCARASKNPPPLVDAGVDLRDFAFMPLDVRRLRDSDLAATSSSDAFRAAVLLWCASWHQVPAASLPDDDAILAVLAGYGRGEASLEAWRAVKDVALRGFVLASDGRHYHPVIAEKALDAWRRKASMTAARQSHAERMKNYRSRRRGPDNSAQQRDAHVIRHSDDHGIESRDTNVARYGDGDVTSLIGQGQGQNTEISNDISPSNDVASPRASTSRYSAGFLKFWHTYPRKVGKDAALQAWRKAKQRHGKGSEETIQRAAEAFAVSVAGKDPQYTPHPSTWLNQGRFEDQTEPVVASSRYLPVNRMAGPAGG